MSISSRGPSATATEEATRSKKGYSSALFSATPCTSGMQETRGNLVPVPSALFHNRSPRDLLTREAAPAGCVMRKIPPSPTTLPPADLNRGRSALSCPGPPPSGTGVQREPSSISQSTALHRPSRAVNTWSPMSKATAAPQPSLMSGWLPSSSRSRSSKVPLSAASTAASSAGTAGNLARRSRSFVWKLRAQNSAAMGPGSPAQDCPSKSAYSPMGALLPKIPVFGCSSFSRVPILFKSFTITWRTNGFCFPSLVPPRDTASTSTFGGSGGSLSTSGIGKLMGMACLYCAISSRAFCSGISTLMAISKRISLKHLIWSSSCTGAQMPG
mmetsp:Transcript_63543/g.148197  ORF Transcript_63543/g.148197 Transcript_63543/m.148197 type:complete len:328 (-) Transcript_63543:48-1031(-)